MNYQNRDSYNNYSQRGNNQNLDESIPSPYNFIKLSEKVVFVDEWGKRISQDIPFKDGLSGCIEVEVETESPIFIRNSDSDKNKSESKKQSPEFFQLNQNEFYIPGSSFKGMLRNTLEIATFSKMAIVDDKRSIRDLHNQKDYTDKMTIKDKDIIYTKIKAGWLVKINDQISITPCEMARVHVKDLETFNNNIDLSSKQSASSKYKRWGNNLKIRFDIDQTLVHRHSCGSIHYKKAENLGKGKYQGTLVMTGQPMTYRDGDRRKKHLEFIFFDEKNEEKIVVDKTLFKDFEFIHSTDDKKPNEEWSYWLSDFNNNQKVPIFYLTDNKGNLHSFGLAMMYRLPYSNSIRETIRHTSNDHLNAEKLDMAEAIFGYVRGTDSLKGRVHIGHFKAETIPENRHPQLKTVLGSPKPTYYPNYLEQNNPSKGYVTYMSSDAKIRGWKRYPVEMQDDQTIINNLPKVPNDNEDVATIFKPLPKGSKFKGKIHYHNLKPVELGALLWSLTFGNRPQCKHKIGMAKPLGFGTVSVSIISDDEGAAKHVNQFIGYIEAKLGRSYEDSEQIRSLIAMSDSGIKAKYSYKYPKLQTNPIINEFSDYKKARKVLTPYIEGNQSDNLSSVSEDTALTSEIIDQLRNLQAKKVIRLLNDIGNSSTLTDEMIEKIGSVLRKRPDYGRQNWATDNQNYLSEFEKLKKKKDG